MSGQKLTMGSLGHSVCNKVLKVNNTEVFTVSPCGKRVPERNLEERFWEYLSNAGRIVYHSGFNGEIGNLDVYYYSKKARKAK